MNSNSFVARPEHESTANLSKNKGAPVRPRHTRVIYDLLAPFYPVSSRLFHTRAHGKAIELLNFKNGSSVLEVAMGSGEMFQRLVKANPRGQTIGSDFSANMAAHSQAQVRRRFGQVNAHCPCTDARQLPFRDASFHALVCCYLFELLSEEHTCQAMDEFSRVLKPGGRLALISVGQNESAFNLLYRAGTLIAPAFWGRQVSSALPDLLRSRDFHIEAQAKVRQLHFRSRVVIARKAV